MNRLRSTIADSSPQSVGRSRFQFRLSWLIALPLIVAPTFLGLSVARQVPPVTWELPSLLPLFAVFLIYVVACCWMAIRHLNRFNSFRRFPFRGSLLLGGTAGMVFSTQFAVGGLVVYLADDFGRLTPEIILLNLIGTLIASMIIGGLMGLYVGLIAGALYGIVRLVAPNLSAVVPKSHRPKQWRKEALRRKSVADGNRPGGGHEDRSDAVC